MWKARLEVVTLDFNVGPAVIRNVLHEKHVDVYLKPNALELEEHGHNFFDYRVRSSRLL